jgi:hypothetical protein
LKGLRDDKVALDLALKDKKKGKPKVNKNAEAVVMIPLLLISKANLEPDFGEFAKTRSKVT